MEFQILKRGLCKISFLLRSFKWAGRKVILKGKCRFWLQEDMVPDPVQLLKKRRRWLSGEENSAQSRDFLPIISQ
jgi:hypothetical protein